MGPLARRTRVCRSALGDQPMGRRADRTAGRFHLHRPWPQFVRKWCHPDSLMLPHADSLLTTVGTRLLIEVERFKGGFGVRTSRSAYRRSSRHSRVAARRMNGLISGAPRRACVKPGRSDWAMTASRTAVRGSPSTPRPRGVAWVSTTLPEPSPSTMRITTVRDSGLVNSATTGIPSLPMRNVTATRNLSDSSGTSSSTGGCVST